MVNGFFSKLNIFIKKTFSINFVDNHVLLYIFGIKIQKKIKAKPRNIEIKEVGVTSKKRETKVILSLTSFPARINIVPKTILTLLKQTLKPDMVILWLASEQFPNKEKDLPEELLKLKEFGLEIKWCNDIRSYKKLIPCLKEFPNDIIITFDDDIYYPENTVELLYNSYLKNPKIIHTNRARVFDLKNDNLISKTSAEIMWSKHNNPSFLNKITGCGGVLYPPNSLNKEVFNEEKFTKIIPTQDDVWFWAMALLNNTKIQLVASFDIQLPTIENSQDCGLSKINKKNNIKGLDSLDASKIITKEYPQIIETIKKDKLNV